MEEHYINDVGKITYVYGVNLEEHKTVIEKQQKRIAELEQELAELKEKAIVPKFKGSSIVYSIAFKEIEKVQVIAYLNRCIILCRNLKTRELHTIHCDYLFETEQEAQAKLKEIQGNE